MVILTLILGIILTILLPLGQIFRINIGPSVALNILDIGVLVFSITSIALAIKKRKLPGLFIPLLIFEILGIVGLLFNKFISRAEFLISLLYLFRFASYTSIIIGVALLGGKNKSVLLKTLLISGGIIVAAGYVQYFFYHSLWGLSYEGWDPHLYRMFSTFLDPNFTGPFFVPYFLLVLDTWFKTQIVRNKTLFGGLGILTFLAVVLTFSRGAYLDLAISVIIYLFLRGYRKIVVIIPVSIIVLGLIFTSFFSYGEEKHFLRTASTKARLVSIQYAISIFEKNIIIGVGFNAYRYAQHKYHLINGYGWDDTHSGAGANNSFVFVLATTGIFGGISYGYFWWLTIKRSYYLLKVKNKNSQLIFSSLIALLISGVFENTLFYPSIMVWMFILIGFMV